MGAVNPCDGAVEAVSEPWAKRAFRSSRLHRVFPTLQGKRYQFPFHKEAGIRIVSSAELFAPNLGGTAEAAFALNRVFGLGRFDF